MAKSYFNPKRRRNFFEKILLEVPSTNVFDLSHSNKLSFNMGELIPVYTQEVYPGDHFQIGKEHLMKMAPLVTPVMHRCKVDYHAFFVPNRILWNNFEKFQAYDTLNEIPIHPFIDFGDTDLNSGGQIQQGSLMDYLDCPTVTDDLSTYPVDHPLRNVNALIPAAYYKICDDYYIDQNLGAQTFEQDEFLPDGKQTGNWVNDLGKFSAGVKTRAWEKDYFTSCLPFAQKGQEVVLPLGTSAPIEWVEPTGVEDSNYIRMADGTSDPAYAGENLTQGPSTSGTGLGQGQITDGTTPKAFYLDNSNTLRANLEEATGASINQFRLAVRLQEFFERNARLGTRYIEQMLGKFGVRISDARAHRSELIGSASSYISFSEVLQTSQTETTPLGQQAGHGMSVDQSFLCNHFVEEHGFIMVICSVIPETSYQQGLPKKMYKKDILDYYDPMFANLGEQAVKNWEIYATNPTAYDNTFGYQSRYAELKYNLSTVHGDFRSTLADWHLGRIFPNQPELNASFVESTPTHRIFADTDPANQKMYAWIHFNVTAKRKIPFYSTPQLTSGT